MLVRFVTLSVVATALAAGAVGVAAAAGAAEPGPPSPDVSGKRVRLEFDVCRRGGAGCPRRVIAEMRDRWRPLDRRCDHGAVFALTYLRTTQEYERTVNGERPFFSRPRWVNHEDAVFAELYFRAVDRHRRGKAVPEAWRIAFDAAADPRMTALGDMLLGMNAHINRDLPFALAHVGLRKRDGRSRKPDHDRVNAFLARVLEPLTIELGARYDPALAPRPGSAPIDPDAALGVVEGWRESAWRNAERLVRARDDSEQLAATKRSIEGEAAERAAVLRAANTVPGYDAVRDPLCRARRATDAGSAG